MDTLIDMFNNACNYITLDIFYFTVTNQLNLISNHLYLNNLELSFFYYSLLLQINSAMLDYILNNVLNKTFHWSPSEIEYFWSRSSAMQNGFYNKDLVSVQVHVSNFLIKTDLYKYISIKMNEQMEYIVIELGFCARFVFSIYFFLVYLVFFINSLYGTFSKLDKLIDKISAFIDYL